MSSENMITYILSVFNDFERMWSSAMFAMSTSRWNAWLENSLFRYQMKLLIPSQPSTAVTVETQTNSPCTHPFKAAEAANNEILPAPIRNS